MNTSKWLASLLAAVPLASSAVGPLQFNLSESGVAGAVVSCTGPDACTWLFQGTTTGSFDMFVDSVIQTAGTWDSSGCQNVAGGEVRFFKDAARRHNLGWKKVLTGGQYCFAGNGHYGTFTFRVEPDVRPGKYRAATGTGTMQHSDNVGNAPGDTGPWRGAETGSYVY